MSDTQYELLLSIYRTQVLGLRVDKNRCNKRTLDACMKKGWIVVDENGVVKITDKGKEDSEMFHGGLYIIK